MRDKKIIWATPILLSAVTSVSYAHEEEDVNEFNPFYLAADRTEEGIEIGGSLLILQANTSSDLDQYAIISNDTGSVINTLSVSNDYDIGFDAFIGYVFENGQDLVATYTYFGNDNSDTTNCNDDEFCFSYPSDEKYDDYVNANVSTTFNQIDLLFGQRFILGEQMSLRFAAGVAAAWIKNGFNSYYFSHNGESNFYEHHSKFDGVGPKVGIDGDYQIAESPISLYMGVSVAGLIGESTATTSQYSDGILNDVLDSSDEDQFVTNLNADLGLRYQYELSEEVSGNVMIGYRIYEYFDAMRETIEYGNTQAGTVTQIDSTTNYSLNGPYVTLSALF